MVPLLLLLPLLWGESLQENPGYRLQVQESLTLQAGLGVLVPCSFSYPWSSWYSSMEPFIYWFREGDDPHSDPVATNNPKRRVRMETRGRFHLLGDPSDKDCSLSIRDTRMSDAGVYYFRVERDNVKYSYRDKKLALQVTAPPGKPYIQFPEPLEAGRPTNLTCSLSLASGGGHPLLFSWVGEAVDTMDPGTLHSSELTLTPRPQDHGTNLTCQMTLQGSQVTLETTIQLNVSYAPQLVTTRISQESVTDLNGTSLPILEGQFPRLVCVADGNAPATLSWLWEGKPPSPSQRSAPGVLEIAPVGVGDGGEVTCRAQHPLGSQQVSFSLSVQSPPPCSCETEEQQGSWPLVLTLIRGALMGAGFLLTYGLTWTYYTRCGGHQGAGLRGVAKPRSLL
ncbi:sialic acid-binding Ig-like lectin 14 isoform X2 [Moschus berezovskii]|uniref:sialic acid-binding Ig-like lectin 14 isoform X2 n=1 Tax=Moschus berezovskii TaxID=68408 RepID=UPI0024448034|nr:sialic acid-binding Ig-like lectin 14 isoform X2 [Moschus berezovskii]